MLKNTKILFIALFFVAPFFMVQPVFADHCPDPRDSISAYEACQREHDSTDTADTEDIGLKDNPTQSSIDNNPIVTDALRPIINFLLSGVFILITISVVIAGIQYTTSNGDPQKTQKAVERLTYAGIAIVLYVFGFAILQWILPGGTISL